MRIKKIPIQNYKSLVDFELDSPPPFCAFVGPNASGMKKDEIVLVNKIDGQTRAKIVTNMNDIDLDISQAASHPNCPSATYFVNKLNTLK